MFGEGIKVSARPILVLTCFYLGWLQDKAQTNANVSETKGIVAKKATIEAKTC